MGKIFTRRGMRLFSIGITKNFLKFYMSIPFAYGLSHNKHSYEYFNLENFCKAPLSRYGHDCVDVVKKD